MALLWPPQLKQLKLLQENDKFSFNNQDRYYTQGLRMAVNHENGFYAALTQEINTPADTLSANPPLDDQPYSAAVYFSYGHGRVLERGGRRDVLFVDLAGAQGHVAVRRRRPDDPELGSSSDRRTHLDGLGDAATQ